MTFYPEHIVWQQMRQLRHQANQAGVVLNLRDLYDAALESLRTEDNA